MNGVATAKKRRLILLILLALFLAGSLVSALIPAGKDMEHLTRSSSLRMETVVEGNVTEIRYLDADGEPAFAADLNYATLRRTADGKTVREEYLDERGEKQEMDAGHYAVLREYNDRQQNIRTTYLDADNRPMENSQGYVTLERTYNEAGQCISDRFLAEDGSPVESKTNGYGREYAYDAAGNRIEEKYLDAAGKLMKNASGAAIVRRTFYPDGPDAGRVEREFYFDESGAPVTVTDGEYGVLKEYDELGRNSTVTFLDAEGKPMTVSDGYTTLKRTFYNDDSVRTIRYFDAEGTKAALPQGQYGVLLENDQVTYLDADGNEIFNFKNFLYNLPVLVILAAVLVVAASLLLGKRGNLCLLIFYFGVILYMTMIYRSRGTARMETELFWSYKQFFRDPSIRKEIMDNIWLFVPLGTVLYRLYPKLRILLVPVLLSAGIEILQYFTGLGLAELDDLINNSLGGLIGYGIGYVAGAYSSTRVRLRDTASKSE